MGRIGAAAGIALFLILGLGLVLVDNYVAGDSQDPENMEYREIAKHRVSILCPTDDGVIESFLESHSVPFSCSGSDCSDSDVVLLTKRWVENNPETCESLYEVMARQGTILILVDAHLDFKKTDLSISYSDGARVNAYWMIPNKIRCNSPGFDDVNESLEYVFDWIESKMEEDLGDSGYGGELGT